MRNYNISVNYICSCRDTGSNQVQIDFVAQVIKICYISIQYADCGGYAINGYGCCRCSNWK